jgi:DNA-binding Lrp family transcriptional regulator
MSEILDEKDRQIIQSLIDGLTTTRAIAKRTLLPRSTIHHRILKLEKTGIIKKHTIELDYQKIGKNFLVFLLISANLQLLKEKKKTQYDLAKEIKRLPFVEKINIVAGGTDLIAIIRVGSVEEYDKALLGKIQPIEGIDKTQSLIVIHGS